MNQNHFKLPKSTYVIRNHHQTRCEKRNKSTTNNIQTNIIEHVLNLKEDPRPFGCKKLVGDSDYWRIRVGKYRIIYTIEDEILTIEVIKVVHRKDVYR